ncbi:MAG: hypothetical protein JJE45_00155 [Prolixibacteraceae bacterium]|nr:hypothetical protein [Prolixibacteraceae bacterium]
MKEHPILFSTPMVQAILDGRKTQTRRIIKIHDLIEKPDRFRYKGNSSEFDIPRLAIPYDDRLYHSWELVNSNACSWVIYSHKSGDILWVRETHYAYGHWTRISTTLMNSVKKEHHFHDLTLSEKKVYMYEDNPPETILKRWGLGYHKRPSIFMPKEACRIKLEITGIRVERVQDISNKDALDEGIDMNKTPCIEPTNAFAILWDSINLKRASWNSNPWVWVIEFKNL